MSYLRRAWAEISLDALIHNFSQIRKSTNAKIFSVVKADAYGHSVSAVARLLDEIGTDYFAVSNINEAKELRTLGIKKPVLILGYTPCDYAEELQRYSIIQTVFSLDYAKRLNEAAAKLNAVLEVHLKLDTGMGRIGFNCRTDALGELKEAKEAISLKHLNFSGIFTHFPSADSYNISDKEETKKQYNRFVKAIELLEKDGFKFKTRHCCNSAATMLYPEMHLDAVRPGIILYGLTPSTEINPNIDLKPVMTFKSVVSQIKTLNENETVSYGRTYVAEKPVKIATVSTGYADGVPRLLSGKGTVLVSGKKADITGRVCMDQFCVDVTDIDGVKEGDTVVLFGEGLPVEELAEKAQTINYEVVCGISKRVPRIYIKDGKETDI